MPVSNRSDPPGVYSRAWMRTNNMTNDEIAMLDYGTGVFSTAEAITDVNPAAAWVWMR